MSDNDDHGGGGVHDGGGHGDGHQAVASYQAPTLEYHASEDMQHTAAVPQEEHLYINHGAQRSSQSVEGDAEAVGNEKSSSASNDRNEKGSESDDKLQYNSEGRDGDDGKEEEDLDSAARKVRSVYFIVHVLYLSNL
jgi:hypothetical protein